MPREGLSVWGEQVFPEVPARRRLMETEAEGEGFEPSSEA